jgi:hypothetical protein
MMTAAYSVSEFCNAHRISRAHLYNLWRRGEGPARMSAGRRRLVSVEAAALWRQQMESQAPATIKTGDRP